MAFTSLNIPNFRALRNLEVHDLRRINILVGKNNSGKTSLLEAVELLCCVPKMEAILHQLKSRRGSDSASISPLDLLTEESNPNRKNIQVKGVRLLPLFNYVNDFSRPELIVMFSHLKTQPSSFPPLSMLMSHDPRVTEMPQTELVDCKEFTLRVYVISNKEKYELHNQILEYGPISSQQNRFFSYIQSGGGNEDDQGMSVYNCCENTEYHFIQVSLDKGYDSSIINKLIINRNFNNVIECLKKIDNKIKDLKLLTDGSLIVDIAGEFMLPLSAIGEGTRRIFRLLTYLLSLPPGGVCLIDEIDTGLHYTALPVMWRAVLQAAEANDVQLFATTHSNECIEALVKVLAERETPLEDADCALYRLEQEEDGTKAYRYDMIAMEYLNQADLEVR